MTSDTPKDFNVCVRGGGGSFDLHTECSVYIQCVLCVCVYACSNKIPQHGCVNTTVREIRI